MNTRLQVEHAVTEMVTGIDLVAEQLRRGRRPPPLLRKRIRPSISGHAIEMRINAEDPAAGFIFPRPANHRPTTGNRPGPGVRVDSWVEPGDRRQPVLRQPAGQTGGVGAHPFRRPSAGAKRALHEYRVARGGHHHPRPSGDVLDHPVFAVGPGIHTRFLEEEVSHPPGAVRRPGRGRESGPEPGPADSLTVEVGRTTVRRRFLGAGDGGRSGGQLRPALGPQTGPSGAAPSGAARRAGEPGMVASPMQGTIVKVSAGRRRSRVKEGRPAHLRAGSHEDGKRDIQPHRRKAGGAAGGTRRQRGRQRHPGHRPLTGQPAALPLDAGGVLEAGGGPPLRAIGCTSAPG